MRSLAPLHIGSTIDDILAWQELMPDIPLYALSDSAFHTSQPPVNRHYNIPLTDTIDFDIFRFGYHGISCASIVHALGVQGSLPSRIIVCHLGSGCSVVAIKDGKSIRASMGFTPLEGLCMSTRVGTIDAGALLYLQSKKSFTSDLLYQYLNTECGLKGLSGTSGDMREVFTEAQIGNTRSELALDIFVRRIQEAIAASIVTLQGVDLIVFTATISEKSPLIRELICTGLHPFGIMHDSIRNGALIDKDGEFNRSSSKVKLAVVKTDELAQMARELDVVMG